MKRFLYCALLFSAAMLAGCTASDNSDLPNAVLDNPQSGVSSDVASGSQTDEKITDSEAKNIALKHAGLSADAVSFTKSRLELDDGAWEYEIEFIGGGIEYEYTINAVSGEIIEFSSENDHSHNYHSSVSSASSSQTDEKITDSEAKNIALKHAGLSADAVSYTKSRLELDNGAWEYEIEFIVGDVEYEYTINAVSGEIIEFSSENDHSHNDHGSVSSASSSRTDEKVTDTEAKNIALKHAGLSADAVSFTKSRLELDNGAWEYEIEFIGGGVEYEYTINAVSGDIIEFSSENDHSHNYHSSVSSASSSRTDEKITDTEAKNIALKHSGLSADAVSFTKSKLELDDGAWKYEIEFISGDVEYEYTINAVNGEIIEFSSEKDD